MNNSIVLGNFFIKEINELDEVVSVKLFNKSGEIKEAVLRDNRELFLKQFHVNDFIKCKARERSDGVLEVIYIKREKQEKLEEKIDEKLYIQEFNQLVDSVEDKHFKWILKNIFNEELCETFFSYPASVVDHHSYSSGLLQHTIEVTKICNYLSNIYRADRDLLITAALLHDIGVLRCVEITGFEVQKTNWEYLVGVSEISALFVSKIIYGAEFDYEGDKILKLYHLLLNHDSKPLMIESFILKEADQISSQCNKINCMVYDSKNWSNLDTTNQIRWFRSK
jgi:23S rRNA maturation-related 3'-5' exoribonuclease YhaM